MTIKTKKRIVKVRQPSNIYFRLREIVGLPKPIWKPEPPVPHVTAPTSLVVDQELLEWILRAFKRHYDPKIITEMVKMRCFRISSTFFRKFGERCHPDAHTVVYDSFPVHRIRKLCCRGRAGDHGRESRVCLKAYFIPKETQGELFSAHW